MIWLDATGIAQTCVPVGVVLVGVCRNVSLLAVPLAGPACEARLSRLWLPPATHSMYHISQLPEAGVRPCMAPDQQRQHAQPATPKSPGAIFPSSEFPDDLLNALLTSGWLTLAWRLVRGSCGAGQIWGEAC